MIEFVKNMAVATGEQTATIFVTGEIDEDTVITVATDLETCKVENVTEITFQINSPGGSVKDGMALYDAVTALSGIRTKAFVTGVCASAATYLALACDTVVMAANADFMVHECFGGLAGDLKALETGLEYFKNLRSRVIAIYCAKTGKTPEEIETVMDEAKFLNAKTAVSLGFVDFIEGDEKENEKEEMPEPEEKRTEDKPLVEDACKKNNPKNFWSMEAIKNFLKDNNISLIKVEEQDTATQEDIVNSLTAKVKDLEGKLEAVNKSYNELKQVKFASDEEIKNKISIEVANRIASMGYASDSLPAPAKNKALTQEEFRNELKNIYTNQGLVAAEQFIQNHPLYNI